MQAGPKEEQEEDELEYWNEALRTLKLPSLCHGHSVKGPGLVAMARDDAGSLLLCWSPPPKSPVSPSGEPNVNVPPNVTQALRTPRQAPSPAVL